MKQYTRNATLLFLHLRNELSESEKKELAQWQSISPDNEGLLKDLENPEYVRLMMKEFYKNRQQIFDKMKSRFSYLSDIDLSEVGEYEEEEIRRDFPDKNITASGLSKLEFWGSLLEGTTIEEKEIPDEHNRVEEPAEPYGEKVPVSKGRRYIRILARLAAAAAVAWIIFFLTPDLGPARYRATVFSPGGDKSDLDAFHRGFLAGKAHIRFEKMPNGEPIYNFPNHSEAARTDHYTLETSNGNEFVLRLPDGTQVWMNAESSITFPANYSQDTINLKVQGEVYFESAAKSGKHFIISTVNGQRSTVNGKPAVNRQPSSVNLYVSNAHFLLSAYPEDSLIRVGLVSGTVRTQWEGQSAVQLGEQQQVSILNGNVSDNPAMNQNEIMALKNGELYFNNADIRTIMSAVSRWYDVDIYYEGGVPDKKFSLHVPIGADLSVISESLKKQDLRILVHGKTITIFK